METTDDTATPDDINLAGFLYEVYCEAVGGVAFNGDKLPDWTTFYADKSKAKQVGAWISVAVASRDKPFEIA